MLFPPQAQLRAAFGRGFYWKGRFPSKGFEEWVGLFNAIEQRRRRLLEMGQWEKKKSWQGEKFELGDRVWVLILSSLRNLFPTNLGSGSSHFFGYLYCLCNSEGNRARSYFSRPLPLSSQGDKSQMSGHADETVGEQQAGRVDGRFASHPQEHNQIFK